MLYTNKEIINSETKKYFLFLINIYSFLQKEVFYWSNRPVSARIDLSRHDL